MGTAVRGKKDSNFTSEGYEESVNTTPNFRTFRTSAHVNFSRAVLRAFHLTSSAHSTRTPIQTCLLFLSHGDDHCDDPRSGVTFGQLAEPNTLKSYEPNDLIEMNNAEVSPIQFHRPCDSAESVATSLLKSDLDDEQIKHMLASPLYQQEREASADQPRVHHSYGDNDVSSSSRFRARAERPTAVFSHKRKSSQAFHSDRDGIPLAYGAVSSRRK